MPHFSTRKCFLSQRVGYLASLRYLNSKSTIRRKELRNIASEKERNYVEIDVYTVVVFLLASRI